LDMLKRVSEEKGRNFDEFVENLKHKNQWHVSDRTAWLGGGRLLRVRVPTAAHLWHMLCMLCVASITFSQQTTCDAGQAVVPLRPHPARLSEAYTLC
jgi:hypothetical protein